MQAALASRATRFKPLIAFGDLESGARTRVRVLSLGQTIGSVIAGGISQSDQMSPAEYQANMDQYNAALDSGASPDQLSALYHNLGLDGVTAGAAPLGAPVEVGYLPPVAGTQLSMDDVRNIGTTALSLFRQQYESNGGGSFQQVNLLGDGSGFLGLPSAKDLQNEIQNTLSDLANQASQATGDAAKALRAEYNAAVRLAATVSISQTIADPSTSADARMVLQSFLTGDGPRNFYFEPNSTGVAELFNYRSSDYYYAQEDGAIGFMLNKYPNQGGTLRDGNEITYPRGYTNGSYNALYGAWGLTDGTQMGDITGTFSKGLAAHVADDMIYFHAENDMDLVSFAAGNLFKVQNDLINIPTSGPLSTVHMTFEWGRPVPDLLRYDNFAHH